MAHHKCKLLRDSTSHLPKLLPNAAWHQKLKRRVRKLFLVSFNHPEVYMYLKSKPDDRDKFRDSIGHDSLYKPPPSLIG
jgi:hypothetical protein